MVLVDSSSWIEALRVSGKLEVRRRVDALLSSGRAAWCNAVRLELWNGARGIAEKNGLRHLDQVVPNLAIDDRVWEAAIELAKKARAAGLTAPATDILIVSCAHRHGVSMEHSDAHMDGLLKLR